MRLSELMGKEIVNLYDGTRLGTVGDSDLVIDAQEGGLESLIVPSRGGLGGLLGDRSALVIPWSAVRKVGNEVIVVELDGTHPRPRKM